MAPALAQVDFELLAFAAAVAILGMVLSLAAMFGTAFWRHPETIPLVMTHWSQSHAIVRFVGVLVIVPAICALGMLDKISGGEAITAISAIAGYVLSHAELGWGPPRG